MSLMPLFSSAFIKSNLELFPLSMFQFSNQSCYVSSAQKTANGSAVDNRSTTAGSPKTFAFETHTSKYSQRFQGSKGKINRSKADTGTVVFPDEIEEEEEDALPSRTSGSLLGQKKNKKKDALESCGRGSTICEKFDDYPKDILKEILAKKIGKNYQATVDVDGNSFLIPDESTRTNPESPDGVVRTRINDIFTEKTKPKISPKVPGQDILSFGKDQDSSYNSILVTSEGKTTTSENYIGISVENAEPEQIEYIEDYESSMEIDNEYTRTTPRFDESENENLPLENDVNISRNKMLKAGKMDDEHSSSTTPRLDIIGKRTFVPLGNDLEKSFSDGSFRGHGFVRYGNDLNALDNRTKETLDRSNYLPDKADDVENEKLNTLQYPNNNKIMIFQSDKLDDTSIRNRIGTTEEYLCHSTPQVKFLHAAESKNGEWKLIVNDDDKFVQGVRVEQCSKDNAPCKYADHFPPNLSAKCAQKFIYRRLVAFNKETKELFNDDFKIPSCCVCVVSRLAHGDDSAERRSMSANAPEPLALTVDSAEN
ncbi:hypothetical protein WDU94_011834 [Cyamophila willieti]